MYVCEYMCACVIMRLASYLRCEATGVVELRAKGVPLSLLGRGEGGTIG